MCSGFAVGAQSHRDVCPGTGGAEGPRRSLGEGKRYGGSGAAGQTSLVCNNSPVGCGAVPVSSPAPPGLPGLGHYSKLFTWCQHLPAIPPSTPPVLPHPTRPHPRCNSPSGESPALPSPCLTISPDARPPFRLPSPFRNARTSSAPFSIRCLPAAHNHHQTRRHAQMTKSWRPRNATDNLRRTTVLA